MNEKVDKPVLYTPQDPAVQLTINRGKAAFTPVDPHLVRAELRDYRDSVASWATVWSWVANVLTCAAAIVAIWVPPPKDPTVMTGVYTGVFGVYEVFSICMLIFEISKVRRCPSADQVVRKIFLDSTLESGAEPSAGGESH